jgi:outer membrane protein insertion porin family
LPPVCDPLKAGTYLCDELGKRLTSLIGLSTLYDDTDGIHPTRGQQLTFSADFAGLGGDVRYARVQAFATKYKSFGGWVFSLHGEGGYIHALESAPGPGRDAIRITDRFFNSSIRGFDIRGIGPRVVRVPYNNDGTLGVLDINKDFNDAIGGKAFYLARAELELPVSSSIKSLGIRPSVYVDAGSLWSVTKPNLLDIPGTCTSADGQTSKTLNPGQGPADCVPLIGTGAVFSPGFKEFFLGNSPKPRISIGIGANWISPFGPLRLDLAKAIVVQKGDDPKLFTFNVGTSF